MILANETVSCCVGQITGQLNVLNHEGNTCDVLKYMCYQGEWIIYVLVDSTALLYRYSCALAGITLQCQLADFRSKTQ